MVKDCAAPGSPLLRSCCHRRPATFGADRSAVRNVVVHERDREGMPGELGVRTRKLLTGFRGPEALQIHHQERHVVDDVNVTQAVVELDAIEDARAVVETVDVGGLQISVSIAREPCLNPACEQVCPAGNELLD